MHAQTLVIGMLTLAVWCCGCAPSPSSQALPADSDGGRDAGMSVDSGTPMAIDGGIDAGAPSEPTALRLLVFTKTAGFRHDSIGDAKSAFTAMAQQRQWTVTLSENNNVFATQFLERFDVVVFLSTTGDILGPTEQTALEAFVKAGGGFVGIHSASDTEYDWMFYGADLMGAYFMSHPSIQQATVKRTDSDHQSTRHLPLSWSRTDEWYNFRTNPKGKFDILLTVDESTYSGGTMGAEHPIAWSRTIGLGRSLYTALGHTKESWREPLFVKHIEEAVAWAGRR